MITLIRQRFNPAASLDGESPGLFAFLARGLAAIAHFFRWASMIRLLSAVALVGMLAGCDKSRTPSIYEIPQDFKGWVLIEFGRSNCPPVPKRDGKLIFHIDANGRLCTSSTMEYGWAKDTFYYVGKNRAEIPGTAPGLGGLIWGEGNGSVQRGTVERSYQTFFIGTEDEFKHAPGHPVPEQKA